MAFPPSKGKKNRRKEKEGLTLNSMMDMMTIILLFLLKSFSTSGALIQPSPLLELPSANRDLDPKKAIAILVTRDGILEDMEGKQPRVLATMDEMANADLVVLPNLEAFLVESKEFKAKVGIQFKGEITVQCDKDVPYEWLLKVINTCGQAEYGTIDFVVKKAQT